MLGLAPPSDSGAEGGCPRRFVPRLPPSYGRPHHPYAAMMYPEFQYRPPPPSYQASMQEYRLRLLLLDRAATPQIRQAARDAVSPPPTYRSHAGSLLRAPLSSHRDAAQSEYSCPPSYRSQNSTNRQGNLQSNSVLHSREQSLSLSESNHGGSVVNVVNILGSTEEDIAKPSEDAFERQLQRTGRQQRREPCDHSSNQRSEPCDSHCQWQFAN
ncbi:unnamed protein product [Acanthoscelides obtectus]|uniref:Uncharacterized protein n=1 Tax=Acanthoscelides obtectus TaxID=200917 RepID=A0A9P0LIS6_ACAOB|nr:unnamed protein product [Acanthoscelides obtectus]CAK1663925.1 hypothetical protein AOBTE_LOCUS23932 [Acanthoscelides obtectus]